MKLKENDFIEIEFTGKLHEGEIFDSNIKGDLDKSNMKGNPKSFIFCLGKEMFVKGVDEFLIGKEIGEYNIPLSPEKAFGKRNPKLIRMVPLKNFIQHKINPIPGSVFNFDGKIAKILTVSGGRVIVDFNNPLAGKKVEYFVKVLRKVEDKKEQVEALNDFFFKQKFDFKIDGGKLIIISPKEIKSFIEMFKEKYKEILSLELEVVESDEKLNEEKKINKPKEKFKETEEN